MVVYLVWSCDGPATSPDASHTLTAGDNLLPVTQKGEEGIKKKKKRDLMKHLVSTDCA